jgi:hypothetical protein
MLPTEHASGVPWRPIRGPKPHWIFFDNWNGSKTFNA